MTSTIQIGGGGVVHCCTLSLLYLGAESDDHHRNPNINTEIIQQDTCQVRRPTLLSTQLGNQTSGILTGVDCGLGLLTNWGKLILIEN